MFPCVCPHVSIGRRANRISYSTCRTQLNLSQKGQVCEAKVQSAVNTALSTAFLRPQMGGHQDDPSDPGLINGAY